MGRKLAVIIAVSCGLLAVLLTNFYFQQQAKEKHVDEAAVVVAASDIAKGALIEYEMLTFKKMPVEFIQPGALNVRERAIGKTALATIMQGEQVLTTKLAAPGTGLTLAGKTPPGKRAVTIGLENVMAVGGMVYPGDHVDVLGIFKNPPITLTLFQDVLILAVGQQMVPARGASRQDSQTFSPRGKNIITFAMTPQEVQILTVAMEQGKIGLTLRPQMEVGRALPTIDLSNLPPVVTFQTLLQLYTMTTPPDETGPKVEIIRGLKKEITPITVKE